VERITDLKYTENLMRIGNGESIQRCRQPRRYKLALLTVVGLLAPVYFVPPALSAVLSGPRLLTVSAAVAGIVALMTYVIMPVLTKLAASWLFEQPSRNSQISGE
jgi:antibiotic biosynthesis monooxygenase (ABM) superfamily enzyme